MFFRLLDRGFVKLARIGDGLHRGSYTVSGVCPSGHFKELCACDLVMVSLDQVEDLGDLVACQFGTRWALVAREGDPEGFWAVVAERTAMVITSGRSITRDNLGATTK